MKISTRSLARRVNPAWSLLLKPILPIQMRFMRTLTSFWCLFLRFRKINIWAINERKMSKRVFTGTTWFKLIILVFEFGGMFEKATKDKEGKKAQGNVFSNPREMNEKTKSTSLNFLLFLPIDLDHRDHHHLPFRHVHSFLTLFRISE